MDKATAPIMPAAKLEKSPFVIAADICAAAASDRKAETDKLNAAVPIICAASVRRKVVSVDIDAAIIIVADKVWLRSCPPSATGWVCSTIMGVAVYI